MFTASEGPDEGALTGQLVRDLLAGTDAADLHVFLACNGGELLGCIMFTRLRFPEDDRTVFLMAPVAVATASQRQGVGQGLISHGLDALRKAGVDVAVTYGDPGYYGKTGFEHVSTTDVQPPLPLSMPHGWLAQSLDGRPLDGLKGPSACVKAFDTPQLW